MEDFCEKFVRIVGRRQILQVFQTGTNDLGNLSLASEPGIIGKLINTPSPNHHRDKRQDRNSLKSQEPGLLYERKTDLSQGTGALLNRHDILREEWGLFLFG